MKDPRVDKMIEILSRYVYDLLLRSTHDNLCTTSIPEYYLMMMLEELDKDKFDEVYNKAMKEIKGNSTQSFTIYHPSENNKEYSNE